MKPTDEPMDDRTMLRSLDEFTFDGTTNLSLVRTIREAANFRECVWAFAVRSLRVRYAQAALGIGWAVVQPLAFLAVFVIFFGGIVGFSGAGGVGYAAFAIAALVPWQFVSSSVSFGGDALIGNAELVRKVYFPREAPVLGTIGAYLPDLGIGILLVLLLSPITGAEIGWQVVFVPLLCVAILVPAVAIAIPLAGLAVYYRDFKYALPTGIQLWFFASPVVYPITVVSPEWRWLYALLNPVVGMLEGFRRVLAQGASPDWGLLGISLASSLVLLFAGLRVFKRLEGEFADVI
jgi:lipopolysaccharide transport system permease protein